MKKKQAPAKDRAKLIRLIKEGKARWMGNFKLVNLMLSSKKVEKKIEEPRFTEVKIADLWKNGLIVRWGAKGVGFGEITFHLDKRNRLRIYSELMGREFVKRALSALVDSAVWKE